MIGQTLGHYRVLEQIGAGGMGLVFRAQDERLNRDVALKVLPPGTLTDENARKRFRQEALALSKLNHPNIETVHDFDTQDGIDFLVMELIPGVTLDEKLKAGPLPELEVRRLGAQLAEGLAAAHEQSVIHRDLKPGNLRLTLDGRLKILDFGLAKLLQPISADALTDSLSQTHGAVGTMPYMAPEQLRGESVDARSDIWAAGAVLYEMAAGRRPFPQASGPMLVDAILNHSPAPPSTTRPGISSGLDHIVLKALDKSPRLRYQSAKELLVDLERLTSGGPLAAAPRKPGLRRRWYVSTFAAALLLGVAAWLYLLVGRGKAIDSVAVMPFVNASGDLSAEYLSDGVSESIINNLSQLPELRVKARSTVFRYKGQKDLDPEKIGRDLRVRAVVMGQVTQRGDSLIVEAELVDTANGSRLWGNQYNRKLADILGLQEEISKDISEKLRLRLSGQEAKLLVKHPTDDPEAYRLYLQGCYFSHKFTVDGLKMGVDLFRQALERDGSYARAYAGMGESYVLLANRTNPGEYYPKAEEAAKRAVQLDDTLAEAHTSLGLAKFYYEFDWRGAEREFRRAIELRPEDSEAHHWYSHLLLAEGRAQESLKETQRALEIDPLSPELVGHLAWHYFLTRQYDLAVEQARKGIKVDPSLYSSHLFLGWAYEQKRMYPEATAEFEKVVSLTHRSAASLSSLGHVYALAGRKADAEKLLDELQQQAKQRYVSSYFPAIIYLGLGNKEEALHWLERTSTEPGYWVGDLKMEPRLDSIRTNPRFKEIVRRVGLPQ
jgi:TolB-like protein/Flp pilus assembly protein TadD